MCKCSQPNSFGSADMTTIPIIPTMAALRSRVRPVSFVSLSSLEVKAQVAPPKRARWTFSAMAVVTTAGRVTQCVFRNHAHNVKRTVNLTWSEMQGSQSVGYMPSPNTGLTALHARELEGTCS